MAYDPKGLSVLAYSGASAFTLWHYTTSDLLRDVTEHGYFNAARDMLRVDDQILIGAYDAAAQAVVCTRLDGKGRTIVVNPLSAVLRVR